MPPTVAPRAIVVSAVLAICVTAACTSSTETPPGSSGGTGDDAGAPSSSDAAATGDGGLGETCAAEKTIPTCATCCGGTESLDAYEDAYVQCACDGPCKTPCATTICAGVPVEPTEACEACLDEASTIGACDPPANDACEKDAACRSFIACDAVARCLDKPEGG